MSLDTEKTRLKVYFYQWGKVYSEWECKVAVLDWSVSVREAQVELAGTVIKALDFRLPAV